MTSPTLPIPLRNVGWLLGLDRIEIKGRKTFLMQYLIWLSDNARGVLNNTIYHTRIDTQLEEHGYIVLTACHSHEEKLLEGYETVTFKITELGKTAVQLYKI